MSTDEKQAPRPQLAMVRNGLGDLPAVSLPRGYGIRSFRDGDAPGWCRIITESFRKEHGIDFFETKMRGDAAFRPARVFFVVRGAELVATASAWRRPRWDPENGYLHMVGCRPAHAGRGLGRAVSLAALHRMASAGCAGACLHTDDFRLAALKPYLRLGFVPRMLHENQVERWRAVLTSLGRDDLIESFRPIFEGPLFRGPDDA